MTLRPTGDGSTYHLDADWKEVSRVKSALRDRDVSQLINVGDEVGRAALFGSAAKFSGRDVTAIKISPTTSVPYPQGKANVDWDKTEKINRVPLVEVDPHTLSGVHASQPGIQHGALSHYLNQNQFGGDLFDKSQGVSNDFPVVFNNEDTGEKTLLSGHHRATAALIQGRELRGRIVRGQTR
jgi:hypothetical protein